MIGYDRSFRWKYYQRRVLHFSSSTHLSASALPFFRQSDYCFSGSLCVLLLFMLLGIKATTMTIWNPSLKVYKGLYQAHGSLITCACSKAVISHEDLGSLSPTLHQVCSSDFVNDKWIASIFSLDLFSARMQYFGWYGLSTRHFRLLSTLCQLANRTVSDSVHRFDKQSLITLNVIPEADFNAQLNITFDQFKQSFTTNFDLLVTLVQLVTQVDQPYTMGNNAKLILSIKQNATESEPEVEVYTHFSHS